MTSQSRQQTIFIIYCIYIYIYIYIYVYILPNISRSKENQAMNFGLLIEYNIRSAYLDKSDTIFDG